MSFSSTLATEYRDRWYSLSRTALVNAGLITHDKLASAYQNGEIATWTFVEALVRECGWHPDKAVSTVEQIKALRDWEPPARFIPGYAQMGKSQEQV